MSNYLPRAGKRELEAGCRHSMRNGVGGELERCYPSHDDFFFFYMTVSL